ncbi:MAG: tagaturonate reductase [Saprospiraceae bacterium]|nr:tagaturonate reductase [Saprospiraceae bacterium]
MNLLNKKYAIESGLIAAEQFALPERVLQFGTGVLLRGLPDYLIDKANKQGVFNGRIVIVKTTNSDSSDFDKQDGVFTLNEKGIDKGETVNQTTINTSISRVISANENWAAILACAENLDIDIIISNTTEAGVVYVEEDIFATPPQSFPSKLTAILYKRFKFVQGDGHGFVIVPTELLVNNGNILRGMVERHAERMGLEKGFINWLKTACYFCNSLVDRIVPGATPAAEKAALEAQLGYTDNLMINSEPFLLWAIEGDDFVKETLSFTKTDSRAVVTPDITQFREQKLRLLNGGHTISVPLAYLSGLRLVNEMMNDAVMGEFVEKVVLEEILPTLDFDASDFAKSVLDRFKNPFIEHKLLSITVQCSAKMNMRNGATFERYLKKFGKLPERMCLGFAAYLLFTRPVKEENGRYFGQEINQNTEGADLQQLYYPIQDDHAAFFYKIWQKTDELDLSSLCDFVDEVLANEAIFDETLRNIPVFAPRIAEMMFEMTNNGISAALNTSYNLT